MFVLRFKLRLTLWPDALQMWTETFRLVLNNWGEENDVCFILFFPVYGSIL